VRPEDRPGLRPTKGQTWPPRDERPVVHVRGSGRGGANVAGVPFQTGVSNNSMSCGTTIGPITAARHGINTVDISVAILPMHSVREMCGADDPFLLTNALVAFLED
jgi:aspartyl aminopeptidase